MTDSTRRVLRTSYQIAIAIVTALPVLLFALPADIQATPLAVALGAWIAAISRIINSLEDAGLIPSWLKQ